MEEVRRLPSSISLGQLTLIKSVIAPEFHEPEVTGIFFFCFYNIFLGEKRLFTCLILNLIASKPQLNMFAFK